MKQERKSILIMPLPISREDIANALKASILEVFPNYADEVVDQQQSLHALGANSIDRAEIIMLTLIRLQLKIPLIEFAKAKNIDELIGIFYQKKI